MRILLWRALKISTASATLFTCTSCYITFSIWNPYWNPLLTVNQVPNLHAMAGIIVRDTSFFLYVFLNLKNWFGLVRMRSRGSWALRAACWAGRRPAPPWSAPSSTPSYSGTPSPARRPTPVLPQPRISPSDTPWRTSRYRTVPYEYHTATGTDITIMEKIV